VAPGKWAGLLFDAAASGVLSPAEANAMIIDYVAPSLDTTILAAGHMLWRLATTPGAFAEIKQDPGLIPGVVNEVVRLASPIRHFTRLADADYSVGDQVVAKGQRLLVIYASANGDERHYERPDEFDVRRNPRDHVGWGHGVHSCAGMHLARMELEALLKALVEEVDGIECHKPAPLFNNILQGFRSLPVRLI
jgi:cytochrome P450